METGILEEIENYWDHRAESYSEVITKTLDSEYQERWSDLLLQYLPNKNKEEIKILDIGTGPGFFPILYAKQGYFVTAIDYTEEMLNKARENTKGLESYITFQQMDAHVLDFEDDTFDMIVTRNLTWNLESPDIAYKEWLRVLKKGGKLLNFDATWYNFLFDDKHKEGYQNDRDKAKELGLEDHYLDTDTVRMENIASRLPLGKYQRPQWDAITLLNLGVSNLMIDTEICKSVWNEEEQVNYASTPGFLIVAEK